LPSGNRPLTSGLPSRIQSSQRDARPIRRPARRFPRTCSRKVAVPGILRRIADSQSIRWPAYSASRPSRASGEAGRFADRLPLRRRWIAVRQAVSNGFAEWFVRSAAWTQVCCSGSRPSARRPCHMDESSDGGCQQAGTRKPPRFDAGRSGAGNWPARGSLFLRVGVLSRRAVPGHWSPSSLLPGSRNDERVGGVGRRLAQQPPGGPSAPGGPPSARAPSTRLKRSEGSQPVDHRLAVAPPEGLKNRRQACLPRSRRRGSTTKRPPGLQQPGATSAMILAKIEGRGRAHWCRRRRTSRWDRPGREKSPCST